MIVLKFGGTSVEDAAAFGRAIDIIEEAKDSRPLVVVSALAKTTARLTRMGADAAEGRLREAREALTEVMDRHRVLAHELGLGEVGEEVHDRISAFEGEMLRLLVGIDVLRECTPKTRDHLATFGERMSSMLLVEAVRARALDGVLLDAFQIMITDAQFGRARPDLAVLQERVDARIRPLLASGRIPIMQGYIGATAEGTPTTMGFEASDFTATLLGAALDASEIQIWTDVPGMLSADNRVVPGAVTLSALSFVEAEELAHLGASVIHPDAVRPAALKGIPVRILNSRAPRAGNTVLSHQGDGAARGVRSVALLRGVARLRLAPREGAAVEDGFARGVLDLLARNAVTVEMISATDRSVALALRADRLSDDLRGELEALAIVNVLRDLALVSIAGAGLEDTPEVASRALASLATIPLHMIAQGASPLSLSVLVPGEHAVRAVRALHGAFVSEAPTLGDPGLKEKV